MPHAGRGDLEEVHQADAFGEIRGVKVRRVDADPHAEPPDAPEVARSEVHRASSTESVTTD
jgi:hypothetical protein